MPRLLRSAMPVVSHGRGESKPAISIGDNGQIRFSTVLTKEQIAGKGLLDVVWNEESRTLQLKAFPAEGPFPKNIKADDLFPLKLEDKDGNTLNQAYFGASNLFGSHGITHDYKKSSHVFEAVITDKGYMSIIIPADMPARVVAPRKPKAPATPPAPAKAAAPAADLDDVE